MRSSIQSQFDAILGDEIDMKTYKNCLFVVRCYRRKRGNAMTTIKSCLYNRFFISLGRPSTSAHSVVAAAT